MDTEQETSSASERSEIERLRQQLFELHARHVEIQFSAWTADQDRQRVQLALTEARTAIERLRATVDIARHALTVMQDSKFWKIRNRWFSLKRRMRGGEGAMPHWLPPGDPLSEPWLHELPYERWLSAHAFRESDRRRLRDITAVLPLHPTFSVLMPVYDTPKRYLREAIESVIAQVYPYWELCIVDDASQQPHVRAVLESYAADHHNIKVVFRKQNGHISQASNDALAVSSGDFIALFDHDDRLAPDALFENAIAINRSPDVDVLYSDEDKIDESGQRSSPYFKPDWAPDSLLARNYVSHLGVYRRSLVHAIGGFRMGFEGSQDYDLLLRVTERTNRVVHIPRVLYHWREHAGSTAAARHQKSYAHEAAQRALQEAIERRGEPGRVEHDDAVGGLYTVRYEIRRSGLVSIIIPTRNHGDDVDLCLRSIFERSSYSDIEIVLLDNGSTEPSSLETFEKWVAREPRRVKVVRYDAPFNFSAVNNIAASHASGAYFLFLNNDTEVITPDWIEAMMEQAQRPEIGAVGAKLLYSDDTVQHAGVIVGLGGVAGHSHKHFPADQPGYFYTLQTVNNFSAVTGACLMLRRDVFSEVGGFDEELAIAFNDVDLCLRIRVAGYRNIYLPHVVLYHYESKSRGAENTPEKQQRFLREQIIMRERWKTDSVPDPYYNVNLSRETENFEIGTSW